MMSDRVSELLDGFSEAVPFTSESVARAPNEPGVHIAWGPEPGDGIVYVGWSGKLRDRLRQHLSGDRQASVLFEQVGKLLDGDVPDSAGREAIQEWLARCRVAWISVSDPEQLTRLLVEQLKPRFNRRRVPAVPDSGVWWVNQGRSFDDELAGWIVFAGSDRPNGRVIAHHHSLSLMRAGNVTLHYASGFLRAIGIVHAEAVRCPRPYGPEPDIGLRVAVEYFPLDEAVPLASLPGNRAGAGPFDRQGAVRQGYCFALSEAWANSLRTALAGQWPLGSPWAHGERRFWAFQASPDQWDLAARLPEIPPGTEDTWTASKSRAQMQPGDGVVLWSAGRDAGIYGMARLIGPPQLRDRPDFRPESVGDQEWEVPLVITAHVEPPILKSQVQADPRLADLSVLRTPWAGTNQPVTADQWRAVVSSMHRGEPMTNGWDALVHWARRISDTIDLEAEERSYKLMLAGMFGEARAALAADAVWLGPLKQALDHRDNNLLSWRIKPPFKNWIESNSEEAGTALRIIWDGSISHEDAVEGFAAGLPTSVTRGAGTRASLASVLRLAVDPEGSPVFRPSTFKLAYELTGFGPTEPANERNHYADAVAFCDQFIAEAGQRGLHIADRLDAQGLVWAVVNLEPPAAWSTDEQAALKAYRAGEAGPSDATDRITELVRQFRRETGYPADGDPHLVPRLERLML